MSGCFQQLEAPERYYNNNGVSFGYVVRVQGLNRSLYLNDINEIQNELVLLQSPGPGQAFYITTGLFKSRAAAHFATKRYYDTWGEEYGFGQGADGHWYPRQSNKYGMGCLLVESQIMEFE